MLKEKNYFYKIKTATDILLAHYLISSEQIEGKLLKGQDNSENIWLKYTTRIDWYKRPIKATIDYFFNTDSPLESIWAKGIPATELIELSSVDIFKEFTITSDSDDKLADEIIILVDKYETFVKIVKSHIFVNQGKIHYTTCLPGLL